MIRNLAWKIGRVYVQSQAPAIVCTQGMSQAIALRTKFVALRQARAACRCPVLDSILRPVR